MKKLASYSIEQVKQNMEQYLDISQVRLRTYLKAAKQPAVFEYKGKGSLLKKLQKLKRDK